MKDFHISDIISVTTGRLVSSRHIEGIYDILNFMTEDNLFTHQLPRAMKDCEPSLRRQFPQLFPDQPVMSKCLQELDNQREGINGKDLTKAINEWVECVRITFGLPEHLQVEPLHTGEHQEIDPIQELEEKIGKDRVVAVRT